MGIDAGPIADMPRRPLLVALFLLAHAAPSAAADGVVAGGVMRFATGQVAFIGGFGGMSVEVWSLEPYGYLSHDAGVWAVQAGVAVPVMRLAAARVLLRFGASTAVSGPAVEPDVNATVGAGVRIGRRVGVTASVDRAREFTLTRAGLFVGW